MNARHLSPRGPALLLFSAFLSFASLDCRAEPAAARVWHDASNRALTAQYVGRTETAVTLRTADGQLHEVPLSRLSPADAEFARSQPAAGMLPAATAALTPEAAAARIDHLVGLNLAAKGLKPNPPATDEQFVRRAYLDIVGRIPRYDETVAFLNDSRNRDKRSALIDHLLADKGHASHLFNYFSDMLRLKHKVSEYVSGASYVQWIKESLAANKPYDQMVREMMTASGPVWRNAASGYIMRDAGMPLDNVSMTSQLFLGTDMSCAQCHDHPFDDWTQFQFYQMAAYFGKTKTQWPGAMIKQECKAKGMPEKPLDRVIDEFFQVRPYDGPTKEALKRFVNCSNQRVIDDPKAQLKLPDDYKYKDAQPGQLVEPHVPFGSQPDLARYDSPRAAFAAWLTADDNPRFAMTIANRLWSRAFGRAVVEPVIDLKDLKAAQVPGLIEELGENMKRVRYDLRQFERILYRTQVYQREASTEMVEMGAPYPFPGPLLRRLTGPQMWDSMLTMVLDDPDYYQGRRDYTDWEKTFTFDVPTISGKEINDRFSRMEELNSRDGGAFGWPKYDPSTNGGKPIYFDERIQAWRLGGEVLVRSSDFVQPVGESHLLRQLGMTDRNISGGDHTVGSVPIALALMNGKGVEVLTKKGSRILDIVDKFKADGPKVESIFLSVLSRMPTTDERSAAYKQIRRDGLEGFQNVAWALMNTREFLFVQ